MSELRWCTCLGVVTYRKANVLVLDCLDVEADGGDGGHDLTQLELIQDGRLTGGVKTHLQHKGMKMVRSSGETHTTDVHPKPTAMHADKNLTHHQNTGLRLRRQAVEELGEKHAHLTRHW